MPDWLGILLGGIIGFTTGIIGSLLTGIGCLFGSESGCANFPQYFKAVTFFGQYFLGILALIVALLFLPTLLRTLTRTVVWLLRALLTGLLWIAMLPLRMIARLPRIVAWLHYFFVPHPATHAIKVGRRYRIPDKIDPHGVATAMKRDSDPQNLPPAYKSENQRRRAEELQKLAEADRKLLEELEARERARRKMERAKRGEE